jgi:alkanesulfonate monooxygenase SsuD/methylene tetrahydromethanopterin reductase-like flavin-dependent oxidoreductase (luciferase family)
MDVSYWASSGQPWSDVLESSRWAESAGWCGIWVPDHFMPPRRGFGRDDDGPDPELEPVMEAFTLQAALGALVPRVRVGAMVAGNTYRHPAVVANMAATIDHISGGRFVLGIGAGWQENEHEHYGIALGSPRELSDRLEEACEIITSLLTSERTTFVGDHYQLVDAPCEPKPVQERIPLMIGGGGERRTLRTVARWGDEWNIWGGPELLARKIEILTRRCEEIGRDAGEIRKTACGFLRICENESEAASWRDRLGIRSGLVGTADQLREIIEAYRVAGVDELVIPDFGTDRESRMPVFERFSSEIFAA